MVYALVSIGYSRNVVVYNVVYIGSPVEAEIEVIVFAQDAGTGMAQGNYGGGGGIRRMVR